MNHTLINIELYDQDLLVHFGDKEDLKDYLVQELEVSEEKASQAVSTISPSSIGKTIIDYDNGIYFIWLKELPITDYNFGVLVHEIAHAAIGILNSKGMRLTHDSEEAYTYLMQYITIQIFEDLGSPFYHVYKFNQERLHEDPQAKV